MLSMVFYSLFPYSPIQEDRFPFADQEIAWQTYIDYAARALGYCFFCLALWEVTRWREILLILLLLVGYFFDYLLTYNNPIAYSYVFGVKVPLSYTTFMVVSAGAIVIKIVWPWVKQS